MSMNISLIATMPNANKLPKKLRNVEISVPQTTTDETYEIMALPTFEAKVDRIVELYPWCEENLRESVVAYQEVGATLKFVMG